MNFDTIYIEKKVRDHPQTNNILKKIKYNNIVFCENYKEIFNSKKQNFRIQKLNPSIITNQIYYPKLIKVKCQLTKHIRLFRRNI